VRVGALPSVPCPSDSVSASVAFLGRCGRRLRTTVVAWTPCACRCTLLVLRKDKFKVKTTVSFGGEDPVSATAAVDTGAGPSIVSKTCALQARVHMPVVRLPAPGS